MSQKLEKRAALVNAMVESCGGDIAEAFRQGVIGPRQYREFLARCSNCKATSACRRLLAQIEAELPDGAPEYCENKEQIEELKQDLQRAASCVT